MPNVPPRPPERPTSASKNDHKLRALAIKKKQIHVVGALPMKLDGIPVFLDVEGMPDRDFYYLVGLRFDKRRRMDRALILGKRT